jgi:hypothetical protein
MSALSNLLPEISYDDICSKVKKYGLLLLFVIMNVIVVTIILAALIPVFICIVFFFDFVGFTYFDNSVSNGNSNSSMIDIYLFSAFIIVVVIVMSTLFVKCMEYLLYYLVEKEK